MESRRTGAVQGRESGAVDNRPTKRPRVEDEDALDNEEEEERTPRVAPQASDLYLDTVHLSRFATFMRALIRVLADKPRQSGL